VDLTDSYLSHFPQHVRDRYEFRETRNASAILKATNPEELDEIVATLDWFALSPDDVTGAGGNKSDLAARLDRRFREIGWREGRHDTTVTSALKLQPYRPAGEDQPRLHETVVENDSYKVDNVKSRVALDVEWNAKDGNLDRDVGAYRALYDAGIIDVGVIITRTQDDLRQEAVRRDSASTKFKTTTTTNLGKLLPRMTRGDSGGCPLLAIAVCVRTLREPD